MALFRIISITAMLLVFSGLNKKALATSYQAADVFYMAVAPNVYTITAYIYRDCAGPALQASEILTINSSGCTSSRTVTMGLIPGSETTGINLYCPSQQAQATCTSTAILPNFEKGVYQVTVTLNAAEILCPDLLFSLTLGNRATAENLAGNAPLYTEAYMKVSSSFFNNSPEFSPTNSPVIFVCKDRDVTIGVVPSDIDGDSLSYEFVQPLAGPNVPVSYAQNTNPANSLLPPGTSAPVNNLGMCVVFNMNVAPSCSALYKNGLFDPRPLPYQTAILPMNFCSGQPGTNSFYSLTSPLPVAPVKIDWVTNCRTNIPVINTGLTFDPVLGVLKFTPGVFHPATVPAAGRNKYALSMQINEWRKINGTMTKIGHVRREMIVIVSDCENNVPYLVISNPTPIYTVRQDSVWEVQSCMSSKIVMRWRDNDTMDILNVSYPEAALTGLGISAFPNIPGLIMKPYNNNQKKVDVEFYITPLASEVGKNYFFRAIVQDNGCPMTGQKEIVIRISIKANNRVAPIGGLRDRTVSSGDSTSISIVLMRPDSIFQNGALSPAAYQYHWTETNAAGGLPNGLKPADQYNRNIVVKPTQTTRYFLSVTSPLAGCIDTTSVIVRIGSPTGINKNRENQPVLLAFPNPFSDQVNFTVALSKQSSGSLIIYNLLGREIDRIELKDLAPGEQSITWKNAGKQASGQYIARLVTDKGIIKTIKFNRM